MTSPMHCLIPIFVAFTAAGCCTAKSTCTGYCASPYTRLSPKCTDKLTTPGRIALRHFAAAKSSYAATCGKSVPNCSKEGLRSIGHVAGALRLYPYSVDDGAPKGKGWKGFKPCAADVNDLVDRAFSEQMGLDGVEIDAHSAPHGQASYVVHNEPPWNKLGKDSHRTAMQYLRANRLKDVIMHFATRYADDDKRMYVELKEPAGCSNRDLSEDSDCSARIAAVAKEALKSARWKQYPERALNFVSFSRHALQTAQAEVERAGYLPGKVGSWYIISVDDEPHALKCDLARLSQAVDRFKSSDREWLKSKSEWLTGLWFSPQCFSSAPKMVDDVNRSRKSPLRLGVSTYQSSPDKVRQWWPKLQAKAQIDSLIYDIDEDTTEHAPSACGLRESPAPVTQASAVRVDAHAHIFNGKDTPLFGFIQDVGLKDENTSWAWPKKALALLTFPAAKLIQLDAPSFDKEMKDIADALEQQGIRTDLPQCCEEPALESAPSEPDDESAPDEKIQRKIPLMRWIRASRLQNAKDLIERYPSIDIFVTATLDMDYWVAGKSITSIPEQITMFSRIAMATQGRMLPFVGYDPFRDVMEDGAALRQIKEAVAHHGVVGVKLYPPLGFLPAGNERLPKKHWNEWKPTFKKAGYDHKSFAQALDVRLAAFFDWAHQEDVPIMFHSNISNYIHKSQAALIADPRNWIPVLKAHPGIRLNFGHFGGYRALAQPSKVHLVESMTELMALPEATHVFADLSHFKIAHLSGATKKRSMKRKGDAYLCRLNDLMQRTPVLAERLMYGSDWYMANATKKRNTEGPKYYDEWLRRIWPQPDSQSAGFMGDNAVRFLGLRDGQTRKRLEAFYERVGISPAWLKALGPANSEADK